MHDRSRARKSIIGKKQLFGKVNQTLCTGNLCPVLTESDLFTPLSFSLIVLHRLLDGLYNKGGFPGKRLDSDK